MNLDDKEQEKAQQKKDLENAPVTYEWALTYSPAGSFVWLITIVGGLVPIGIMIGTIGVDGYYGWVVIGSIITLGIGRYLMFADKNATFKITPLGIIHTEKDCVPDIAYTIMRGIAWLGVVLCIFAVFYVGPMAFVGAGASALMAFKFTGFHAVTSEWHEVFSGRYILKIERFNRIKIWSAESDDYDPDELFLDFQPLYIEASKQDEIIDVLSKSMNVVKVVNSDTEFRLAMAQYKESI